MKETYKNFINTPVPKILALGKNYVDHTKEMGCDEMPKEPVIFTKPWTSLNAPGLPIKLSKLRPDYTIHYEAELGVVIGKKGKHIKAENWKEYIGDYFLALDMSDRTTAAGLMACKHPWDLGKGQDTFCPVSEFIEASSVKDPHNLGISLQVNGQQMQYDSTNAMYYKIPAILEYVSKYMTLIPGDLILTGTPAGVGPVKVGDTLNAELKQGDKILAKLDVKVEWEE